MADPKTLEKTLSGIEPGGIDYLNRGTNIGRYVVLEPVGSGGMGVVYAAYDPELNRRIALKLLRSDGSRASEAQRARLIREAQAMARVSPAHDSQLSASGQLLGTPAYMAPEQYHGGTIDGRSDQFSFCVALYEALYGERPFRAKTLNTLAFEIKLGNVREPPSGSGV